MRITSKGLVTIPHHIREAALPPSDFTRLPLPWEAGFLAGKAFLGARRSPLPDFSSEPTPQSPACRC